MWQEGAGGAIASHAHAGAVINVDCGSCDAHTVAKAIAIASDATPIAFAAGQLHVSSCSDACLNGGEGPATPPCKDGEEFLPNAQTQLESCASPSTQGWQRTVVA
jgi:hypothetical protein